MKIRCSLSGAPDITFKFKLKMLQYGKMIERKVPRTDDPGRGMSYAVKSKKNNVSFGRISAYITCFIFTDGHGGRTAYRYPEY